MLMWKMGLNVFVVSISQMTGCDTQGEEAPQKAKKLRFELFYIYFFSNF